MVNFLLPVIFSDGPRPNQKEILSLRAFLLLFVKQLIMKVNIDVNCSFHLISGCAANSGVTWNHSARKLCPVLMTFLHFESTQISCLSEVNHYTISKRI